MPKKKMKDRPKQKAEIDRIELVRLMRRGYTISQAAEKLKLHPSVVHYDWKIVVEQLNEQRNPVTAELVALKLEEYGEIKREAWEGWERSKRDAERRTTEGTNAKEECPRCNGTGKSTKLKKTGWDEEPPEDAELPDCTLCKGEGYRKRPQKVTRMQEGRYGDTKMLQIVLNCLESERDLQALNPAKKFTGTITTIDWNLLAQGIPLDGPVPDEIEQEMRKALTLPGPHSLQDSGQGEMDGVINNQDSTGRKRVTYQRVDEPEEDG